MIRELDARTVRQSLRAKGFESAQHGNRDHELYIFQRDGLKTSFHFKISHGANKVRKDEIRNSARGLGVLGADLFGILSCDLDPAGTRRVVDSHLATLVADQPAIPPAATAPSGTAPPKRLPKPGSSRRRRR